MNGAIPARQRGVALLTALMIVALVAIVGAGMLTTMNYAMHRSGNLWLHEQAWWYAVGVESWVAEILRRDAQDNDTDHLDEVWAQPVDYLPIEGGAISGRVVDMQGRFNLNNLGGANAETALARFARLVELAAETDTVTAQTVAQSVRDWIDADIRPTLPYGTEDNYYLGLDPPYRAANRPLASITALRAIRGVTPELYNAIAPHVAALPETTPINVNTATPLVLAALDPRLDLGAAEAMVERRSEAPWDSVEAFLQQDALAGLGIPAQGLAVSSGYFLATGEVSVGRIRLPFASLLQRGANGATQVVRHGRDLF